MHLESRLHEVYLPLLDVEDLVDLGHQIRIGLHLKGLCAFWFGVVCHLHAHHLLFYSGDRWDGRKVGRDGWKWTKKGKFLREKQQRVIQQFIYKRMIGPKRVEFVESSEEEESHMEAEENQQVRNERKFVEEDNEEEQISWYEMGVPVESMATLNGHNKAVSCIAIEPKGHRMATGGLDYHVRLWDFHGMNKNMNSFRIIEPFTGNAIRNLSFNTTGTHLMVINGNKQITFLDKDGARNLLTVKGYMYVKDLNLTKGHTNTVHDGQFHPINHNEFVTASADGSIRLWDIEQKLQGIEKELAHKTLIRCKDARGAYVGISGVTYSRDGKWLFSGCLDGSLQIFNTKQNLHRPEFMVREAHQLREDFSSIVSFEDSVRLATRSTDGTMKVWDIRKINKPIMHERGLPNRFPGNKLCFSPDQKYLLVGTSVGQGIEDKLSYLHFYNTTTLKRVKSLAIGDSSISGMCWSPAINQIVVGLANGQSHIYFDERLSKMGALKAINKQPRVEKDPKFNFTPPVYLPHSLPLYKERPTNNTKKDQQQLRKDSVKTAKPLFPTQGPHKYGRRNDLAYTQIQHIIQSLNSNPEKVEDARKPLWQIQKYTKEKAEYTSAYQFTQPQQIFNDNPVDTKEFQFLQTLEKICPQCGLKLCTCLRKEFYDSQDQQDEEEPKK